MDFRIVLFENEGYATARGDKGVQDILAAKTESGYIKEGTFPIIITCGITRSAISTARKIF